MSGQKKIMLLGEIGVGKTSLIRRLLLDRFEGTYKGTLGFDLYTYRIDGVGADGRQTLPLVIWDTDGNVGTNIFRHQIYMEGTSAALIVGDLSRPETFSAMVDLANGFATEYPGRHLSFVLNKADLVEAGHAETPPALAAIEAPVITTSAKTGDNVTHAFRAAANAILRREA
jgi:Ras-related protein Rab-5C